MSMSEIITFVNRKLDLQERLYGKLANRGEYEAILIQETVEQQIRAQSYKWCYA